MALSQLVLKATLLTGLLLTGLVDGSAIAGSAPIATLPVAKLPVETTDRLSDQEFDARVFGPAAVELLIETEYDVIIRTVYFPRHSIELTPEAGLALREIANEVSRFNNPTISISSQDGDQLLAYERINTVARGLEAQGLTSASLFTWSEIDMLTARDL